MLTAAISLFQHVCNENASAGCHGGFLLMVFLHYSTFFEFCLVGKRIQPKQRPHPSLSSWAGETSRRIFTQHLGCAEWNAYGFPNPLMLARNETLSELSFEKTSVHHSVSLEKAIQKGSLTKQYYAFYKKTAWVSSYRLSVYHVME